MTTITFALPATIAAVQAKPFGTGYGNTLPAEFTLTAGAGTGELAPSGAAWCWVFREVGIDGRSRVCAVSGAAADYADLVDVDPATVLPVENQASHWDAVVADVEADRAAAAAAAISAAESFAGVGAAVASKVDKGSQVVDANDHGVAGSGDRTAALQAFLDARTPGETVLLPAGSLRVDGIVTIGKNDLTVRLRRSTVWDRSSATAASDGIRVTASGVTLSGGSILNPAVWYDTNATPTYGVIHVTGADCTLDGIKITNVPKVGVFSKDVGGLRVTGCDITGNYPGPQVDTGHYALLYDPPPTGTAAIVQGNTFRSCVQGVFIGNWGATSGSGASAVIAGNVFESCFNHGVYDAGTSDGVVVSGNKFHHCQTPIALTGANHAVTGNVLATDSTGSEDLADVTGISLREPQGCVVTGNTIYGDGGGDVAGVDLANYVANSHTIGRNTVTGNTIFVANPSAGIGIRVGNGNTQVLHDNLVSNNTVYSTGKVGYGVISVAPAAGAVGYGNTITGNNIVVQGATHGVYVGVVQHCAVRGNNIRLEYDAPSAATLAGVYLVGASGCVVSGNDIYCPPTFGANVAWRGIWEDATCSGNRYVNNSYAGDLTKLSSFTPLSIQPQPGAHVDERLPGVPVLYAAPGSCVLRSDGGAGSTLYVKETASSSSTWRAV